jgi:hypothetical protein
VLWVLALVLALARPLLEKELEPENELEKFLFLDHIQPIEHRDLG